MSNQTLYSGYNVMNEAEAWDDYTREIVKKRLEPVTGYKFLTPSEIDLLTSIAPIFIDDDRRDLVSYIIGHLDNHLQSNIGEGQRKVNVQPEAVLIRKGLAAIEITAKNTFKKSFSDLLLGERQILLGQIQRGEFPDSSPWRSLSQQDFFKKLLSLVVESYYSHPVVWSEIGFGGPAYPRGYVRTELNLTDPWEAKSVHSDS